MNQPFGLSKRPDTIKECESGVGSGLVDCAGMDEKPEVAVDLMKNTEEIMPRLTTNRTPVHGRGRRRGRGPGSGQRTLSRSLPPGLQTRPSRAPTGAPARCISRRGHIFESGRVPPLRKKTSAAYTSCRDSIADDGAVGCQVTTFFAAAA